ncbi:MAG: PEGA domain-containing protein [Sandaracinaceae bacterium]
MTLARLLTAGLLTLALATLPMTGHAQPGPQSDARAHFERGVALFDEGRHTAALAEFEAAYRASPNYRVLYNLAQVHARLGQAVRAADTYERFLSEGGDAIDAAQRARAEAELATQQARIGSLDIVVEVPGASVSIDGDQVAQTPLDAPIRVSVGEHTVEVSAAGYVAQQRRISVAGQEVARVAFELQETGTTRGSLRVTSNVRDVEISVDGEVLGRTPLEGSLSVSSGLREVRATRPGYLPIRRTVEVGMGAEAELTLTLEPDLAATDALGRLFVRAPATASVFLDDERVIPPGPFRVPVGDHEVRVEMPGILDSVEHVNVTAEADVELEPSLQLTPDGREARLSDVSSQRALAAAMTVVGSVLILGGTAMIIGSEVVRSERNFDERRADLIFCDSMIPDPACFGRVVPASTRPTDYPEALALAESMFNAEVTEFNVLSGVGYAMVGLGAASILGSVIGFVVIPSDEDAVRVRVSGGLGGVSLSGAF